MTISEVAKLYGLQPRKVFMPLLKRARWVYKLAADSQTLAYEGKIKDGCLVHKLGQHYNSLGNLITTTQVMFTSKGVTEVEKLVRNLTSY